MIAIQQVPTPSIAFDVLHGLTRSPKSLAPRLFYDAQGSELFERITELPEYYLTRTERAIFERHAQEIAAAAGEDLTVIELGAGTATKTRLLLEAICARQPALTYVPIDVSSSALQQCATALNQALPQVDVRPIVADYTAAVPALRSLPGRKLVLYIGSSIGNFEPMEATRILAGVRRQLSPGDALLLGVDVAKSPDILMPAYNDAQGVTAAFNKNILARINRELGADFDLDSFRHVARWNPCESRMEIYLESMRDQRVNIPALRLTVSFAAGEMMHTENSYKFTPPMIETIVGNASFGLETTWTDSRKWFAAILARAI